MTRLINELREAFTNPEDMLELVTQADRLVIGGAWNLDGINDPRYLINEIRAELSRICRSDRPIGLDSVQTDVAKLATMVISAYMVGELGKSGKTILFFIIERARGRMVDLKVPEKTLFGLAYDIYSLGIAIMPFKVFRALVDRQYPGNQLFDGED